MDVLLKIIHLFGLMLGAGAGLGSMAVVRQLRAVGPSPQLAAMRRFFGMSALTGIVLLWLSGFSLWLLRYDLTDFGWRFHLKLTIALLLLASSVLMIMVSRRTKPGTPPPGWTRAVGMASPLLILAAVALAVSIFG